LSGEGSVHLEAIVICESADPRGMPQRLGIRASSKRYWLLSAQHARKAGAMTGRKHEPAYSLFALGLLSWAVWIFFLVTGIASITGRRRRVASIVVVHVADDPLRFIMIVSFPFLLGCVLAYLGLGLGRSKD
jgi:hypothetical protein